jgi:cytochrome c oxidase cbb3-type subunit IV
MSNLTYEAVAKFAQQGGTLYFAVMFLAGLVYAFWPRHQEEFRQLASLPLDNHEDEHVQP